MLTAITRQRTQLLLDDAEIEEFRALAHKHASSELSAAEARAVADRLLRVLSTIREVGIRSSSDSTASVDE